MKQQKLRLPLPQHFKMTQRAWKTLKRRQLKSIKQAAEKLQLGSWYTPSYDDLCQLDRIIADLEEQFSVKNWGR